MSSVFHFDAIGTRWQVDIAEFLSVVQEELLLTQIRRCIEAYDVAYSRFRADSVVTRMARETGRFHLPPDAEELFGLYRKFYEITDGAMTPLIGDVLSAAGYDTEYSLVQTGLLKKPLPWDEVFSYSDGYITMHVPALIDIGAGGKGQVVDSVSALLEDQGIFSYTVDAGGDMRYRSEQARPLRVGLENPRDFAEVIGVAEITNQSICGSAGNRRAWGAFHHIIDPFTLASPTDIAATWVVADSTFLADMLTTALYFVSPQVLCEHFVFDYAILKGDTLMLEHSSEFPGEFFIA